MEIANRMSCSYLFRSTPIRRLRLYPRPDSAEAVRPDTSAEAGPAAHARRREVSARADVNLREPRQYIDCAAFGDARASVGHDVFEQSLRIPPLPEERESDAPVIADIPNLAVLAQM